MSSVRSAVGLMGTHPGDAIYGGPVFEMARSQFAAAADYLQIPADERARIFYPSEP